MSATKLSGLWPSGSFRLPAGRFPYLILLSCLLLSVATAHHGWTGYDDSKTMNLTGTIRASGYDNPHGFVDLDVSGDKPKTWHVVLAPPSRMETRGLPKEALKSGNTATVVGYPSRSDPNELRAERITIAGKTTELR